MSTWIGKTLGKVYIDSLIARGGMAAVYLGMHTTLQREVVVKLLRNDYEDYTTSLERFQREAHVVARLRHPNIVQIFDFDTIEDQPYIVMEYIQGPSLSRYLSTLHGKLGRLELPQVNHLLTKLASALQYAHESGVIHRDVKPANILLLSRSGTIVPGEPLPADFEPILTDFGLVRFLSASMQSSAGKIVGTPAYMSPEQARGESTDERTDIYSLGIVLYEMLAGHVPFDGQTTLSILLKHINEPPPPIPGLAFGFQYILDRTLAKKPEERFQTPNELAAAFNEVLEETSGASTIVHMGSKHTSSSEKEQGKQPFSRKWLLAVLAIIFIGAMGAFYFLNGRTAPLYSTATPTISATVEIETPLGVISSPLPLGPTGLLHFQDGNAIMDQVVLTALALPAPPEGSQYEVWLVGPDEENRLNLGTLTLQENGHGTLTFEDDQQRNLLSIFDGIELLLKPDSSLTPAATDRVAYSYALPQAGLPYARQLLVRSLMVPKEIALIQGILRSLELIDQAAEKMLEAYERGDQAGIHENAEAIMNILVGDQSEQYKDWNDDGRVADPGDGYGLLINADNLGYIQAVYSHADYAVHSSGASQFMISHGESVKVCAQNLALWASQLKDRAGTILTSDASDLGEPIRASAALADQMLNGIDADQDGSVESIASECGGLSSYEYAYRMVDMPLLPVNPVNTPTPTSTLPVFNAPTGTAVRSPSDSPPDNPPANTSVPPEPVDPKPSKRPPRPTKTPKN